MEKGSPVASRSIFAPESRQNRWEAAADNQVVGPVGSVFHLLQTLFDFFLSQLGSGSAKAVLLARGGLGHAETLAGPATDPQGNLIHALFIEQRFQQPAGGPAGGVTGRRAAAQLVNGPGDIDAAAAGIEPGLPAAEFFPGHHPLDNGAFVDSRIHGQRQDLNH
jgi:hypothetical protein